MCSITLRRKLCFCCFFWSNQRWTGSVHEELFAEAEERRWNMDLRKGSRFTVLELVCSIDRDGSGASW